MFAGTASACDVPRDPEGTLERARGGALRVGVTERRPWVFRAGAVDDTEPRGVEAELVRGFAKQVGARVAWTWASEQELFEALERFELDIAAGGFTEDTPWKERVGLTRVYFEHEQSVERAGERTTRAQGHVLATAPGENRTLLELDRYVARQRDAIAQQVGAAP